MSCDNTTSCTAIVVLASRDFPAASETEIASDRLVKRCRSGTRRDGAKAKAQIIPDSVQTVPEYVWGDEGPVND